MANERKLDAHRKILVGAAVYAAIKDGEFSEKKLAKVLDGFLVKAYDRRLFGLPVKDSETGK